MSLETIDHMQLAMPAGGEDAARGFYEGLLGLAEAPEPAELAKRGGCWFEGGELRLHLGVETPFQPARKAHIAFRVDNVAALAARARAAGREVVADQELAGHDRVFIFDPFGNCLEFLRPRASLPSWGGTDGQAVRVGNGKAFEDPPASPFPAPAFGHGRSHATSTPEREGGR